MVMTTSASFTAATALAMTTTPCSRATARFSGIRSKPCTACPALTRFAAIGLPILPRPRKAIVVIVSLPELLASAADQGARDDEAHDFVGAFEDLVHPEIAHQLLDAVIMQIAVAAEQLQSIVGDVEAGVGDEALGHCRPFAGVRRLAVELGGRRIEEDARCL